MQESNTAMTVRSTQVPAYLPEVSPEAIEQALAIGDMAKMSAEIRVAYYVATCQSAGLNPMTRPFDLIKGDDGSVRLYPNKVAAEQLRKLHRVSTDKVTRQMDQDNGIYLVTVNASTPDGRKDEAQGVVDILGKKGTALANALMKCETKAKRRATLSLCGLGYEDSEDVSGHPVRFDYQRGDIQTASPITLLPPATTTTTQGDATAELFGDRPPPKRTVSTPPQKLDTPPQTEAFGVQDDPPPPEQKHGGKLIVQSIIASWKALGYPESHYIPWGKATTASYGLERMEHIPVTDLMKILEEVRSQPRYAPPLEEPDDWHSALAEVGVQIPERADTDGLHRQVAQALVGQGVTDEQGREALGLARAWVAEHGAVETGAGE